jgi:hypothetical protein
MVEWARAAGVDGVEDYIGWAVVEPRPGQWDWGAYQENAREIRKAGLKYVPYVWVQNLPSWVRHGADTRFATCLEHGQASEFLSVFSPKTVEAYDRVFAQLEAALGTQIDALRIGSPCDLFNRQANAVTVELPMPEGPWDVHYPGLPRSITLPPLGIRWLQRR